MFLQDIIDADGQPSGSPSAAAAILQEHWQGVFRESPARTHEGAVALNLVAPATQDIDWNYTMDTFMVMGMGQTSTAPGPDGLPYAVYQSGGGQGLRIVYRAYQHIVAERKLPSHFSSDSIPTFLPKGDSDRDLLAIHRAAHETRPLNLADTDCKLVTIAVTSCLQSCAQKHVMTS